jgi:hypothetical protein
MCKERKGEGTKGRKEEERYKVHGKRAKGRRHERAKGKTVER